MVAHISIEGGKWYSGFGHEIDAMDNIDLVTLEYHRRFNRDAMDEIVRLQAEVERLKREAASYHDAYEGEKIGRELAEACAAQVNLRGQIEEMSGEITAERALADDLARELEYDCTTFNGQDVFAAYRKARGM